MGVNRIGKVDWSAATDDFQICVAAVQGNIERVVEFMPRVARADVIEKSDFHEWPVFDGVREEESVREKFQKIYDEPIIVAIPQWRFEKLLPKPFAAKEAVTPRSASRMLGD